MLLQSGQTEVEDVGKGWAQDIHNHYLPVITEHQVATSLPQRLYLNSRDESRQVTVHEAKWQATK